MISELKTPKQNLKKSLRTSDKQEAPVIVSLFSGGGGLDLGLEAVGFNTVFATDIDPYSIVTFQKGKETCQLDGKEFLHGCVAYNCDICDLKSEFITDVTGRKRGEIDILAGGPPCQAFSVFGKRAGRNDPRGQLVYQYFRLLAELRPKAFIFENVYGLETVENGEVFREVKKHLAEPRKGLKYTISVLRLNAVDYGVPQFRDRIFIIGTRSGIKIQEVPRITKPEGTLPTEGGEYSWRTVSDALRGLTKIGSKWPSNHTGRKHSERIISRYAGMNAGERDHYTRINKLDLKRPSFTIIVGSDNGGGKGHIHPIEPREVTPRESARIQTFPDWWAFSGSVRHPIRQIGNAVPPLLASAIGNCLRKNIFDLPEIPFKSVLANLSQEHLFPEIYGK